MGPCKITTRGIHCLNTINRFWYDILSSNRPPILINIGYEHFTVKCSNCLQTPRLTVAILRLYSLNDWIPDCIARESGPRGFRDLDLKEARHSETRQTRV